MLVKKRDKEVCQKCHLDYRAVKKFWRQTEPSPTRPNEVDPVFIDAHKTWRRSKPAKPEYHHIKPFSEGGTHALDNLVTLCHNCHAEETRKWVAEKAKARRESKQPELAIT
jgi:5-methylcytosine-specific restriction endonuclease McrA